MAYVFGVLVLVAGLLVSIALHEIGHLAPAKKFGVRVSHYFVGFGKTLYSKTVGETEYGLKAVPLGGYVRLVGMFPPADVVGVTPRPGRIAEISQSARELSAEEIRPGEEHRAFYRLSTPKKLVVMLGGPVMNLVLAVVVMAVTMTTLGTYAITTQVANVSQCIQEPGDEAGTPCTADDPVAPAHAAGLQVGDEVVSFAGAPVTEWTEVQLAIRESAGRQVTLGVVRDGEPVELVVTPALVERPAIGPDGDVVVDDDGQVVTQEVGFLGVTPVAAMRPQPLSAVPGHVATVVGNVLQVVVTLPVRVVELAQQTFGDAERNQESIIGIVGVGRFAGEITSAQMEGYGVAERTADMLYLLAALNIALFAFNLIPLVPLDGGHVAGALWEGAKNRVARWRGVAEPRPADTARMMPVAYAVFVLLAGMGILLIYADLVRPVTIGG